MSHVYFMVSLMAKLFECMAGFTIRGLAVESSFSSLEMEQAPFNVL